MRELRFDKRLYSGRAVDSAIVALQSHATLQRIEALDAWVVQVAGKNPAHERAVAGELGNHALGLTVEQGGPDPAGAPEAAT